MAAGGLVTRPALLFALVALGGAAGSCARFALTRALSAQAAWPVGTFVVNMTGCLAFGLIAGLLGTRLGDPLRALLLVGVLGGYTTFSSFSAEALALLRTRPLEAAAYAASSVALGVLAAWAGDRMGSALAR
jgi:CrcB protein